MSIKEDYVSRVYAGFLGMNIGIRLGAPVEPSIWTYERIKKTYGDIKGYVKDFKTFAADDDVNGPVYFLRALIDDAKGDELEPSDAAKAWLNYTREGVGMFWWGGYGISTEHTAYLNLKNGIPAPQSGSIEQNGKLLAEQIGGQIFIDTWGLVNPGNPEKAARFGAAAASVSHDGEGLHGARFLCACIASAFDYPKEADKKTAIAEIIDNSLQLIPADSTYYAVAKAVIDFHAAACVRDSMDKSDGRCGSGAGTETPEDKDAWRDCYEMLVRDWGYDKYGGVCHIIPNAGVCVLAMLYGNGDFARSVEIATMCSWDTDCNAGNVGTVLGVLNGIEGLPEHYRKPINDGIILSGISGYLNNLDVPSYAYEVARLGYRLTGKELPEETPESEEKTASLVKSGILARPGELHFDFRLPGATHNMRISNDYFCRLDTVTMENRNVVRVKVDCMSRGQQCKLFYKPFYRRDEFSDERYMPVLTPTIYAGQRIRMTMAAEQWNGWENLGYAPYVRTMHDKKEHLQGYRQFSPIADADTEKLNWAEIEFTVPDFDGAIIDEVGVVLEGYAPAKSKTSGMVYLKEFHAEGIAKYSIDFTKMRSELGTITPFSVDHGAWSLEEGGMTLMRCSEAFAYAGNYYSSDYSIEVPLTIINGDSHLLLIRAQGAMRCYAAGFEDGELAIYKNDFGFTKLAGTRYQYEKGKEYLLRLDASGDCVTVTAEGLNEKSSGKDADAGTKCSSIIENDRKSLSVRDSSFEYGMFGCGSRMMGRTRFGSFQVAEEQRMG